MPGVVEKLLIAPGCEGKAVSAGETVGCVLYWEIIYFLCNVCGACTSRLVVHRFRDEDGGQGHGAEGCSGSSSGGPRARIPRCGRRLAIHAQVVIPKGSEGDSIAPTH